MPLTQGKKPAAFTFANVTETIVLVNHDTNNAVDDSTNNPDKWEYFYPFVITTGNFALVDTKQKVIQLSGVPANTVIPIPCIRINTTNTTGTAIGLIPTRY